MDLPSSAAWHARRDKYSCQPEDQWGRSRGIDPPKDRNPGSSCNTSKASTPIDVYVARIPQQALAWISVRQAKLRSYPKLATVRLEPPLGDHSSPMPQPSRSEL